MVLRHSIEKRSISKLHDCFSDWDFTKERLRIWNFWTIFKIDGPLVSEKKHPNTQVTGSKGFQNGHHVSIFFLKYVRYSIYRNFVFVRYNLPVPQEESMKASVVEAKLRSKLRESFQVTNCDI